MEEDVIVCRCEDITLQRIEEAVARGYTTVEELKHYLRAGMGPCQGRTCGHLIAGVIRRLTGRDIEEIWPMRSRPPYHPVNLGVFSREEAGGGS